MCDYVTSRKCVNKYVLQSEVPQTPLFSYFAHRVAYSYIMYEQFVVMSSC
jgi:hypothetical protein